MQRLLECVEGRSVALVGNSEGILSSNAGNQIDSADLVIRMNRGLPDAMPKRLCGAIGMRTSVWATAKFWSDLVRPSDCGLIVWMKLTALGKLHLAKMLLSKPGCPVLLWTAEFEQECREFVGADPGTGIRLLWWLKVKASPRSVSCYGMDCWERPSHWSGLRNTPNHSPELEKQAMLRLL